MRRSAKLILLASVLMAACATLAYFAAMRFCAHREANDDLAWLRHEFSLSDSEMQRIRQLHEGYLPKCREMCARIAAKQNEVEAALTNHIGSSLAEQKLVELGTMRAECQAQML